MIKTFNKQDNFRKLSLSQILCHNCGIPSKGAPYLYLETGTLQAKSDIIRTDILQNKVIQDLSFSTFFLAYLGSLRQFTMYLYSELQAQLFKERDSWYNFFRCGQRYIQSINDCQVAIRNKISHIYFAVR